MVEDRMRVFLDMDGVLVDFIGRVKDHLLQEGYVLEEPRGRWHIEEWTQDPEGAKKLINKLVTMTGFWRSLKPLPNALATVHRIQEMGFDLWIATTPFLSAPTCPQEKMEWIKKYLPDLWTKVVLTPNKGVLGSGLLIDDKVKNLRDFIGDGEETKIGLLLVQPWNRGGDPWCPDFICQNWDEVLDFLKVLQ